MDSDDDEGMDFGGPTKFTTVFSLKFDWENGGQIKGWDELYQVLDQETIDPNMRQEVEIGASNVGNRELDPGDFSVSEIDSKTFEL